MPTITPGHNCAPGPSLAVLCSLSHSDFDTFNHQRIPTQDTSAKYRHTALPSVTNKTSRSRTGARSRCSWRLVTGPLPVTKSAVWPVRSRATTIQTCSAEIPRLPAFPPRLRAGRFRWRAPFSDSSKNVSSASAIPVNYFGGAFPMPVRKRWRQRKLVLRWMPTMSAALRTLVASSTQSR